MPRFASKTLVPNLINPECEVLFVGEAPGKDEVEAGEPFVGRSGSFLTSCIERVFRKSRSDFSFANLCHRQPYKNSFKHALKSEELHAGIEELSTLIPSLPNLKCIVALGAWPFRYLAGNHKGGVSTWRGSFMDCDLLPTTVPVMVTYHPAYIIRPSGYSQKPVFLSDLQWVQYYLNDQSLYPWKHEAIIDPPAHILDSLLGEMSTAPIIAVDIETFRGGSISCIGFSDRLDRGLCLTFESELTWRYAPQFLNLPAPKSFQYGKFDIEFMRRNYGWLTRNYAWDTYIASSNLLPEFPRGLAFLNSIYTPLPYYKDDRRTHKDTGDYTSLWLYNIKDVISTLWITLEQQKEVEELWKGGTKFPGLTIDGDWNQNPLDFSAAVS